MARDPIPTHSFVLVLVKRGHRILLVHERKHGGGWYFPAGRVEPGETFEQAALRETKEEAGIDVALEGVLRVEQNPSAASNRLRVFFLARPVDDAAPKNVADEHTLEARFASHDEAAALPLRGDEVLAWYRHVFDDGMTPAPMSLLALE